MLLGLSGIGNLDWVSLQFAQTIPKCFILKNRGFCVNFSLKDHLDIDLHFYEVPSIGIRQNKS